MKRRGDETKMANGLWLTHLASGDEEDLAAFAYALRVLDGSGRQLHEPTDPAAHHTGDLRNVEGLRCETHLVLARGTLCGDR